jgi:predicted TIM-barrel fold metal-dependent hydrolase
MRIISADDHLDLNVLPPDLFIARAPAQLRDAMPRVVENEGGAFWQLEGETISPSGRRAPELVTVSDRGMRPSDPVARLQDMEEDGVQAQVIYGPVHPFRSADFEARAATMRAYNDWIIEFSAVAPDRLITLAQLPSWDPALASAELERVAGRGLRGAQIGQRDMPMPLFDASWEAFWAVAERVGLPVSLHLGGGMHSIKGRPFSWTRMAIAALAPLQMDESLTGMILSGMCERHPDLRLVLGEAGIGWVPYVVERMDRQLRKYHALVRDYRIETLPSETFRKQVWMTFQEDTIGIKLIPEIGADRVMWASDYPHGDGTWPHSRSAVAAILEQLSAGDGRKVVGENAARLYGVA